MKDILGKMRETVDQGIKTVSSRSKELIETAKLRSEIKNLSSEIDRRFLSLGQKVFKMVNVGALLDDELRKASNEISTLYGKITELESEIRRVELEAERQIRGDQSRKCQACGAFNSDSDKFCGSCGAKLEELATATSQCSICHASLKGGAKFCPSCGAKVVAKIGEGE